MATKRKITTEKKAKPSILDEFDFDETHEEYLIGVKVYEPFKVKCKHCDKQIKASIFTTSNWNSHIQVKHESIYAEIVNNRKKIVRSSIHNFD